VFEEALERLQIQLGPDHPSLATVLDDLAATFIALDSHARAERTLERALKIKEASLGRDSLQGARTLELLSQLFQRTGRYQQAKPLLDRALDIRQRLQPVHPDLAWALWLAGEQATFEGRVSETKTLHSKALALAEQTLRSGHPNLASHANRLARALASEGDLSGALVLRERAVSIASESLGPDHPLLAGYLNDLAVIHFALGDYLVARPMLERALRIREQHLGSNHQTVATVLYNLADVNHRLGDFSEARLQFGRAVDIWRRQLGPSHPFVATGLDALASVAVSQGELRSARELYEQTLALRRRTLGNTHPDVAWTLANLAGTLADLGSLTLAARYLDEAIAIYQKSGTSDEPDHFARVLELKGSLEARQGNLSGARVTLASALAERERVFGATHPLTAETRVELARTDFALGGRADPMAAALQAEQAGRDHLRFTVRYLAERQAMAYASKRPRGLDLALSIAAAGAIGDPSDLLDATIRSRGVILDELATRSRTIDESDPHVASLRAAATTARQRYANLVVRSLQESVSRAVLDEAKQKREEAERALAERSAEGRAELLRISAGLEEVRRALPQKSALVSFVRYERTQLAGQPPRTRQVSSYAALITRSESPSVAFVPLGAAAALEGMIATWRDEAAGRSIVAGASSARAERVLGVAASRLRRAVWDPLAKEILPAERIFIVPDGLLSVVNFAALPGSDGRYLAEGAAVIHYLSTERDLSSAESKTSASHALLAVGSPAFDDRPITREANVKTLRSGCAEFGRVRFDDLPGSLREVTEISRLWPAANSTEVTVLIGNVANETTVKGSIAGHRIVHFATHGFFLGSDCTTPLPGTRAVGGLVATSSKTASSINENPLVMSGLALAGANHRSSATLDQDEGILTAEEIAGLNLQGTEWAVLSACDTGLGEIRAGEGVFGLRRAFQIAGARTVIMSLWSVEDESARLWMRALYEGRLQKNLSTADAVHAANISVLNGRRANGSSTHPFYWAAFVAAGDWR
jgi:CHAT domain-containing protein/tetratricopeptide (TPR) repeat protein